MLIRSKIRMVMFWTTEPWDISIFDNVVRTTLAWLRDDVEECCTRLDMTPVAGSQVHTAVRKVVQCSTGTRYQPY